MKKTTFFRLLLACVTALALLSAPSAFAGDVTWNGTITNGTWSSGNFVGGTAPTNLDRAVFSSVSGTQAITVNSTTLNVQGFLFNNTGTTLIGGNGTLQGTNTNITIGSAGITVDGAAGAVTFGSGNPGRVATTINGTQTWMNNGTLTFATGAGGGFALGGNVLTVDGSGTTTITGVISGTAGNGITKNGTGTLAINGANTFNGGLTVNAGTVSTSAAAGFGAGVINLGDTTALNTNAATLLSTGVGTRTNNIDVRAGSSGILAIKTQTNSHIYSGNITLNNGLTLLQVTSGQSTTFSGNITGGSGLTIGNTGLTNNGNIILSGVANTYSGGTTVNSGTLTPTLAAALSGYNSAGKVTFNGGTISTLLGDGVATGWSTTQVDALLGNATKTSGAIGIDTTNGNAIQGNAISGGIGLTKLGTNTLALNQANTYTGPTTVSAGTLALTGSGALADSSAVNVNTSGASFDISGISASGETVASLAGVVGTTVVLGAKTLTVGGDNSNTSYTGVISGAGGGLTKTGSGTLTLSGGSQTKTVGLTSGSTTATMADTTGVYVGQVLAGTGLTSNTTITAITANTSVTLSQAATATNAAASATASGNIYTGDTLISGGGVTLSGGVAGSVSKIFGTGTLTLDGAQLNLQNRGITNNIVIGAGGGTVSGNGDLSGQISGTGTLYHTSPGFSLVLRASNTGFSGNVDNEAVIKLATNTSLGSGTVTISGTSPYGTGEAAIAANTTMIGANAIANNFIINPGSTLEFGGTGSAADLELSGNITGSGSLGTYHGSVEVTLSGNNSYTGTTYVEVSTLTANGTSGLGATTGALVVGNRNSTAAGTAVVLNLSTTAPTTKGSLSGTIATPTSGTNTATINNGGQLFTINQTDIGTFQGVIAGTGGFELGSGSNAALTFTGTNTYTGSTTVTAGTLVLSSTASIASSTIGFGVTDSSNGLLMAENVAFSFNGVLNLNINGVTLTNHSWNLFTGTAFGAGDLNLSSITSNLAGLTFTDDGFGVWTGMDSSSRTWTFTEDLGTLGVVPEPATWLLAAFGLTTVVVFRRRRRD